MSERASRKLHPCSEAIAAAGMAGKNEAVSNRTKPAETLLLHDNSLAWEEEGVEGGQGQHCQPKKRKWTRCVSQARRLVNAVGYLWKLLETV